MKFQYISDLHLENGHKVNITPEAPNLIIAGNIGYPFKDHYVEFLKHVTDIFESVFLVLGNNEYYGNSFASIRRRIGELAGRFKNLIVLDNGVHDLSDGLSIYGTTLWADITAPFDQVRDQVQDYAVIPCFAPEHGKNMHRIARKMFQTVVDRYPSTHKWIVICHFIPHKTLLPPQIHDHPLASVHASDVEEFMNQNVVAVVYGHAPEPNATSKYFCNPLSNPNEPPRIATFDVDDA
jgi:hypothetical protein